MTHHPSCREPVHIHDPAPDATRLDWQPYEGSLLTEIIRTCNGPVCTNVAYQFCRTYAGRYAIVRTETRTNPETGAPVTTAGVIEPDQQGTALNTWTDLLNGTAI